MALHANSSSASDAQKKLAAEKIVRDAPIQGIDFADPVHAFTVWTESPSHFMKHCGSRKTFNDAWAWALKHVNQSNREFPRLCRGGSNSLTFPGVHPRNSKR